MIPVVLKEEDECGGHDLLHRPFRASEEAKTFGIRTGNFRYGHLRDVSTISHFTLQNIGIR